SSTTLERSAKRLLVLQVNPGAHRLRDPCEPVLALGGRALRLAQRAGEQLRDELTERLALAALPLLQPPQYGRVDVDRRPRHMHDANSRNIRCVSWGASATPLRRQPANGWSAVSGTDQDVLEELTRAPSRAAVDVARQALLEGQARPREDLRVQASRVVDDDDHRRPRGELPAGVGERRDHVFDIGSHGGVGPTTGGGTDLFLAPVVEVEQLVGVAVLLVVVDQAGVRRRRDDAGGSSWKIDLARVGVHDRDLGVGSNQREVAQAADRVQRVAAQELERLLDGAAGAAVLVAPVRLELRSAREVEMEVRGLP